jgi:hypothetical protein
MTVTDSPQTTGNKIHYFVHGDWVDALASDEPEAVAQRRREVAQRFGVAESLVEVRRLDEVKYWG